MERSEIQNRESSATKQDDILISLRESEKEKNILLALSNEIVHIQSKEELCRLVQQYFNEIGFNKDIAFKVINEDGKSFSHFVPNPLTKGIYQTDQTSETKHPYPDGFFEIVMGAKEPLLFYLEELIRKPGIPDYLKVFYDSGVREMVCIPLQDRGADIGGLFIFSEIKKEYTVRQFKLAQGMANQVGTAVAKILSTEAWQQDEFGKGILLSLSEDIARVRNKNDLRVLINGKLRDLLPFNLGGIGLIRKNKGTYTAFLIDPPAGIANDSEMDAYFRKGYNIRNSIVDIVTKANRPLVFDLDDLVSSGQASPYARLNYAAGMKEMAIVALRNEEEGFGFFGIFSDKKNGFNKNHLDILQVVSSQLAIAVANIIANEEILERESEKSMLLSLAKDITSCRTYKDVQELVLTKLSKYFQFNEIMICLNNPDNLTYSCYMHMVDRETENHPEFSRVIGPRYFINDGLYNVIQESKEPMILDMDELMMNPDIPVHIKFWHELNVKEVIVFPLQTSNGIIGVASLYPRKKNTFTAESLKLAFSVSSYLGIALSNIRALEMIKGQLEEINAYKSKLERENLYLQEQIKTTYHHEEVIGSNNGLRNVFQLVSNVAPSDSTVLLLGETGTGKELIATAIHKASPRKNKLMVKVNCAALPSHLVESELFGHEKGSFTGATERRIGKFELANNGTLFLDEIGEVSLELQAKLLRALQEKEIERIGGKSVIKTDVRIIAASNRDLKKEVEAGRFRRDLFYRLDVFPITLPPLRERREDIPMLVSHFINKFSKKSGQKIKNVSSNVVREMMLYDWPGNIRELEHFIERSVLMTSGNTITEVHLLQGDKNLQDLPGELQFKSLEENERAHIVSILKKTNGRIRGAGGAAEILKIPPTTLHSKMKKLGIRKTLN